MSMVIPFPGVRRRGFVRRHANRILELSPVSAERYLQRQLKIQAETMERRGIAAAVAREELRRLEVAIRSHAAMLVRRRH